MDTFINGKYFEYKLYAQTLANAAFIPTEPQYRLAGLVTISVDHSSVRREAYRRLELLTTSSGHSSVRREVSRSSELLTIFAER